MDNKGLRLDSSGLLNGLTGRRNFIWTLIGERNCFDLGVNVLPIPDRTRANISASLGPILAPLLAMMFGDQFWRLLKQKSLILVRVRFWPPFKRGRGRGKWDYPFIHPSSKEGFDYGKPEATNRKLISAKRYYYLFFSLPNFIVYAEPIT